MKKTARILAVVLAMVMVTFVFASCGTTLSGTYSNNIVVGDLSLAFSGKNVTVTFDPLIGENVEIKGTYKIEDEKITFDFADDDDDDADWLGSLLGTQSFEKTDAGIKIGGVEYKKK